MKRPLLALAPFLLAAAVAPVVGPTVILDTGVTLPGSPYQNRRRGIAFNEAAAEYAIAWHGPGVRVRRVSANGLIQGIPAVLTTAATANAPQLAWSPASRRYLVVWSDGTIQGALIDADLTPSGPAFTIADLAGADRMPHVAWTGSRWLTVWMNDPDSLSGTPGALYGRFVDADGSLPDPLPLQIGPAGSADNNSGGIPRIAWNSATQKFAAVDMSLGKPRLLVVNGITLAAERTIIIARDNDQISMPDVAADPTPGSPRFLMIWLRLQIEAPPPFQVRGQFFNAATGDAEGVPFDIVATAPDADATPLLNLPASVAYSAAASEYAVTYGYAPDVNLINLCDARAVRVSRTGTVLGAPEILGPAAEAGECSIGAGANGQHLVSFRSGGTLFASVTSALPLANAAPAPPASPAQFRSDGTMINPGESAPTSTATFKGTMADSDPGAQVRLQVEVRPLGTAFRSFPTHESPAVASAATAAVTVTGLADGGYHWQLRAVDAAGYASAWISFGGNAESAADFVVDTVPASIAVTPAIVDLGTGATQQFAAQAKNQSGQNVAATIAWSASGGTITTGGFFTAPGSAGGVTVTATSGTISGTATANVIERILTTITVSPASVTLGPNQTRQFSASAKDQFGATMTVAIAWTATGGSISAGGLFTAPGAFGGPFTISATSGTVSGSATVTMSAPALSTITLAPATVTMQPATTQQFTGTARDQYGAVFPATFTWTATGGTVTSAGLYTSPGTFGTYTVRAASGGVSGTATVTMAARALASITVAPGTVTLQPGATQQFAATARDQYGATMSVLIGWSATGGTINGAGLYTAPGLFGGPHAVAAASGSVSGGATVTMAPRTPASIALDPPVWTLEPGATRQFVASGLDQYGSSIAITPTWSVSADGGAVSPTGLYTAPAGAGTFTVTASAGNVSGSAAVTVRRLVSIELTPANQPVPRGFTRTFVATGIDATGAPFPLSGVTWSATAGSIDDQGRFTAPAVGGRCTVSARVGSVSATAGAVVPGDVLRGDANGDGLLTPADVVALQFWIFLGIQSGPPPAYLENGDLNGDGRMTPSDIVLELTLVFAGDRTGILDDPLPGAETPLDEDGLPIVP